MHQARFSGLQYTLVPLEVRTTDRTAAGGMPAEPAAFAVWLALRKRTALSADWITPQNGASVVQYGGQSGDKERAECAASSCCVASTTEEISAEKQL